ncbi:unnamed protein product [Gordionus sp. m RMFG-2023]|uniref:3-ketodihydrosphingosine reductase-like n=1 Tax=Gordionus sp. m RMFG-2023 TaxID=3053472 RepID=UPI0030E4F54E
MLIIFVTILFGFIIILYVLSPLISPRTLKLNGLHVLITGGSSGIGKYMAIEAIKQGANVTILSRNQNKLYQAKTDVERYILDPNKQKIACVAIDVSKDYNSLKNAISRAEILMQRYVDVLVNCAGYASLDLFDHQSITEFKNLMDVNYLGSVYATRCVIDNMKKGYTTCHNKSLSPSTIMTMKNDEAENGNTISDDTPGDRNLRNNSEKARQTGANEDYTLNEHPDDASAFIVLKTPPTSIDNDSLSSHHRNGITMEKPIANQHLGTPTKQIFPNLSTNLTNKDITSHNYSTNQIISNGTHFNDGRGAGYRIMFVSSQAGQTGIYGCSAYCASKFALRGLAESLQMEVKPYNIRVTLAFPPDTDTPGYAQENLTKPTVTKDICQTSGLFSPQVVAKQLIEDLKKGKFNSYIGIDGFLLNSLTCGMSPITTITEAIEQVCTMSLFRIVGLFYIDSFDRMVRKHVLSGKSNVNN